MGDYLIISTKYFITFTRNRNAEEIKQFFYGYTIICLHIYFWRQLHKNGASNIEQVLEAAPHQTAAARPPTITKLFKLDEADIGDTAGEVRTNS